jgi:hypothetical protein
MTEREQQRLVNHRLAVIRDAEEVTGNVAQTCRYSGNTRQTWSSRHHRSRRTCGRVLQRRLAKPPNRFRRLVRDED